MEPQENALSRFRQIYVDEGLIASVTVSRGWHSAPRRRRIFGGQVSNSRECG